jgi:hypothetical protein
MIPMIAGYVMGQRGVARAAGLGVVANAMSGAGSAAGIEALDERIDRLLLVTEALWTLLKEHGHTDEDLAALIRRLDEADGTADGHRSPAPHTCASCGSKVAAGLPKCQICGTPTGVVPGPLDGI